MIEALTLTCLTLSLAWLMWLARMQRVEQIEAAKDGPDFERFDKEARFLAALMRFGAWQRRERLLAERGRALQ